MPLFAYLFLLITLIYLLNSDASEEVSCPAERGDDVATWDTPGPPKSCRLFLVPRKINNDGNRKLGVFTPVNFPKGMPITPRGGDLVIHLIDVIMENNSTTLQLRKWLSNGYAQDSITSGYGGNFEGLGTILTVTPGVGMLASSSGNTRPNVWAKIPEVDEANLPRYKSPLAGSFTLHYNLTHIVTFPNVGIDKGGEITVDRDGWYRRMTLNKYSEQEEERGENNIIDPQQLNKEGLCLDNLYYGVSTHGYGRGGFAFRYLQKGSIVAPLPLLPISRKELRYLQSKEWKKVNAYRRKLLKEGNEQRTTDIEEILPPDIEWRQQLLLNYCFGHQNSSLLLFPYGNVNHINHAPTILNVESNGPVSNVGLRWSKKLMLNEDNIDLRTLTPAQLLERNHPDGLVLEMVALRDIHPGEEILLDYGSLWQLAWEKHIKSWHEDPRNNDDETNTKDDYSPAYIMDDVVSNLRTAEEQLTYPYPDNVFTACFYHYEHETETEDKSDTKTSMQQSIPWRMSPGLFDMRNLRPCKVISREPVVDRHAPPSQHHQQQAGKGKMTYTAIIQNRPGLPLNERIPKGKKYIVSGIPRGAFRFIDKPYTSDVHLNGAFRQNIGLEETDIFPQAWLDLA